MIRKLTYNCQSIGISNVSSVIIQPYMFELQLSSCFATRHINTMKQPARLKAHFFVVFLIQLPAYLLFVGYKHLPGLLNHRLWLEIIFRELVFARVKQFAPGHTRQDQICRIWLVVDLNLNFFRDDGLRSHPVLVSGHL